MSTNVTSEGHSRGHVAELDGLRGLLALWVAVSHMFLWCGFADPVAPGRLGRGLQASIYSTSAVDAFYILSGFAITFLLSSRRPTYGRFMLGRFFRIYPVYALCLVAATVTSALAPFVLRTASWRHNSYFDLLGAIATSETAHPLTHFLAHATLLHGLLPQHLLARSATALLAPAWSISVEWQFYLCALVVAWLARSAFGMLALLAVSALAIPVAQHWYAPLPAFFPLFLPLFLVGAGSYHLYAAFLVRGAPPAKHAETLVVAAAGAALLFRWHAVALLIWSLAFGSLFVASRTPVARVLVACRSRLSGSTAQFLGRISYPLYLVHWPLITLSLAALLYWRPQAHAGLALATQLFVCLPLAIGAAYALHRLVEAPCMRLGKRLSRAAGESSRPAAPPLVASLHAVEPGPSR